MKGDEPVTLTCPCGEGFVGTSQHRRRGGWATPRTGARRALHQHLRAQHVSMSVRERSELVDHVEAGASCTDALRELAPSFARRQRRFRIKMARQTRFVVGSTDRRDARWGDAE